MTLNQMNPQLFTQYFIIETIECTRDNEKKIIHREEISGCINMYIIIIIIINIIRQ